MVDVHQLEQAIAAQTALVEKQGDVVRSLKAEVKEGKVLKHEVDVRGVISVPPISCASRLPKRKGMVLPLTHPALVVTLPRSVLTANRSKSSE